MRKRIASEPWERTVLVALVLGFLAWSAIFIRTTSWVTQDGQVRFCLFDDAMVAMRYAWNLAHGAGLVWNVGQPVEGYTSLLMTLLMALPALVLEKSTAVLVVQMMGVGFVLGCAWLARRLANQINQDNSSHHQALVRTLVFGAVLLYYPLVYWSLMGMETGLFTLLLLYATVSALDYVRRPSWQRAWRLGIGLGLAFLARPETLLYAALLLAFICLEQGLGRRLRQNWPHLVGMAALLLLPVAAQILFRLLYYGQLLPNTYTLKLAGTRFLPRIRDGWSFIQPFLLSCSALFGLIVVEQFRLFRRPRLFLVALVLATIAYQVWLGGDAWPYVGPGDAPGVGLAGQYRRRLGRNVCCSVQISSLSPQNRHAADRDRDHRRRRAAARGPGPSQPGFLARNHFASVPLPGR
jgi:hypothetical protein